MKDDPTPTPCACETPTPRTDAEEHFFCDIDGVTQAVVDSDFARTLERELLAAQRQLAASTTLRMKLMKLCNEHGLPETDETNGEGVCAMIERLVKERDEARQDLAQINVESIEEERDELRQAVGLMTTLKPDLVMNTNNPLAMMQAVERHVTKRIARMEAMLDECATTFGYYATLHYAKGTEDGRHKGDNNKLLAKRCREATKGDA